MDTTAILTVRNELPYLANCLGHLIANGIRYCVIDNDSTDGTVEMLSQKPYSEHLVEYLHHPFLGFFDWTALMAKREALAAQCTTDWVLFVSADEIMHSYNEGELLAEAIQRIATTGADVIDFNEFVFLPVDEEYRSDTPSGQAMRHYYFFEPSKPRLMRARRRELAVSHINSGGHVLLGRDFQLADETLALRHYIFRDQRHAYEKFAKRIFAKNELARGWHGNRHQQNPDHFTFPTTEHLQRLKTPDSRKLDRSAPKTQHYWQSV